LPHEISSAAADRLQKRFQLIYYGQPGPFASVESTVLTAARTALNQAGFEHKPRNMRP
jgi:hypothetical protein